ncbi:MAG TPA: hypothetical protein VMZ53_05215 [Kofleriaceae bacterium]|nr:hypothetical protein [Kofleriaceae bacterium]
MRWAFPLLLLAGCAGVRSDFPTIQLDCATGTNCEGKLGVGGKVYASREVLSHNEDVLHAEASDLHGLVGVAPGTAEISLIDRDMVVDSAEIEVAPLTMLRLAPIASTVIDGPLLDATYNASYGVTASTPINVKLTAEINGARSIGSHFYIVFLDGERYDCYGGYSNVPRICTGPVWYDTLPIDPLTPGDHVLELQSIDGGRDFSFRLAAR